MKRGLSCCTVDSHWAEPWKEEICRHNANHIIIFLPSQSDRKNCWRAWIVLRILFQPLSHTGHIPSQQNHTISLTITYNIVRNPKEHTRIHFSAAWLIMLLHTETCLVGEGGPFGFISAWGTSTKYLRIHILHSPFSTTPCPPSDHISDYFRNLLSEDTLSLPSHLAVY